MKHYCAEHQKCANDKCLRKPTQDDLKKARDNDEVVFWADYHIPTYGIRCTNFKDINDA